MNLGELEFKAEDFDGLRNEFWFPELLQQANRILREKLEKATIVKTLSHHDWHQGEWEHIDGRPIKYTHTARLVCIEPIKQ